MRDRNWNHCGLKRKLADNGGLTLIEMLCATFILTLLCVMVSTGLGMAAYDYRMLTAEAETELLLNTIVSSLTDRLRGSTFSVKENETGDKTYIHSLGRVTTAGDGRPDAGSTEPAQGTVVIQNSSLEQKALLPDGAYGAVFSEDAVNGKKRRYEVVSVSVKVKDAAGVESDLPLAGGGTGTYPASGEIVTYIIRLTVKDRVTGVSKTTPENGVIVRGLNPMKQIE